MEQFADSGRMTTSGRTIPARPSKTTALAMLITIGGMLALSIAHLLQLVSPAPAEEGLLILNQAEMLPQDVTPDALPALEGEWQPVQLPYFWRQHRNLGT